MTGAGNQGKRAGKQPWIRRPHQKPRQDVSLLACWLAKINFLALAPSQRGWLCKLFGGNLSLLYLAIMQQVRLSPVGNFGDTLYT